LSETKERREKLEIKDPSERLALMESLATKAP